MNYKTWQMHNTSLCFVSKPEKGLRYMIAMIVIGGARENLITLGEFSASEHI